MGGQGLPAAAAIALGLVAGVLLFVPFVAVRYRREGRLTFRQTLLWAGFLVYSFSLWTYTLLPLPDPDDIRCVDAQLHPFQFLSDLDDYGTGSLSELIRNPVIVQVALNVVLFIPLGFFLRLIWRRGIVATTAAGFAISLAIATTQFTGVWGIYPCAYRLFDVDDLMVNTLGALIGGGASAILRPWLRHRDQQSATEAAPRDVTLSRRFLGMACDGLTMMILSAVSGVAVSAWQLYIIGTEPADLNADLSTIVATATPIAIAGILVLLTGGTIGDHAVLIRWTAGLRPTVLARALRYLTGIGGWSLSMTYNSDVAMLWAALSLIAIIVDRRRAGLPRLFSGMHPVDARQPR